MSSITCAGDTCTDYECCATGHDIIISDSHNHRIQRCPGSSPGAACTTVAGTGGVGSGPTQLYTPGSVVVDASDNYIIADSGNHRIQRCPGLLPGAACITVAGAGGVGSGPTQLYTPCSVVVDASGNYIIADSGNHRIQKCPGHSPGAACTTVAGTGGVGSGPTHLYTPYSVMIDASDNYIIADSGNHRIQKCSGSSPGAACPTVAGTGIVGSSLTQLNSPHSVMIDAFGNYIIADSGNHRIQKCPGHSPAAACITVAGTGSEGSSLTQLSTPLSVVLDASPDYIIADSGNDRIQKCPGHSPGAACTTVAGTGSAGSSLTQFKHPSGVTLALFQAAQDYSSLGIVTTWTKDAHTGLKEVQLESTSGLSRGMSIKISRDSWSGMASERKVIYAVLADGRVKLDSPLQNHYDTGTIAVVTAGNRTWLSSGNNTACRIDPKDSSVSGNGTAKVYTEIPNLDTCKYICQRDTGCTGVEYQSSTEYCEIWTVAIGYTASKPGFQCWHYGHDCDTDLSHFELMWPRNKKIWCCYQEGKACSDKNHKPKYPAGIGYYWKVVKDLKMEAFTTWERYPYDCEKALEFEKNWPLEQKLWCCETVGEGCLVPDEGKPEYDAGKGKYWQKVNKNGFSTWEAALHGFSWKRVGGKLVQVAFDCDADLDRFDKVWTSDKKEWCCDNRKKGCSDPAKKPSYDAGDGKYWKSVLKNDMFKEWQAVNVKYHCNADLERFELMWRPEQRKWCCDKFAKGCSDPNKPPEYPAGNGFFWYWQSYGKDALAGGQEAGAWKRADETFDCSKDLDSFHDWSMAQKNWCCDWKLTGCETTSSPPYVQSEGRQSGHKSGGQHSGHDDEESSGAIQKQCFWGEGSFCKFVSTLLAKIPRSKAPPLTNPQI
eukprot:TRINITY_DN6987_c0_g2_i1.p1 TRINITY_DN6987_c0_g2~~TRINITY_DN6987_c0_g2_i1.p1  ORF type:complete len:936 (-),score=109.96 TRINITY_DN6987_c0_g2_i1:185-2836(-)